MKTILVSGGAGFIGSNFIHSIFEMQLPYKIVNVDSLTYAGNLKNLDSIENHPQYKFIKASIVDKKSIEEIFSTNKIDYVVHFAAESHVDRSIEHPSLFLETNVLGTQVLLDAARQNWKTNKESRFCKEYEDGVKFIQVSTDEVYGSLGATGLFSETSTIKPSSPYSASKASADLLVSAYYETYGLPICITRCSNNYGPYQFPEKLIPLMIYNTLNDKKLPIYGDGLQIRDWLHVKDHCLGILTVLEKGKLGEVYNIGGNNEKTNIEIVELILKKLGKSRDLIQYVEDRLGHDRRYAIDNTKISSELGWSPTFTFENGIAETIDWYLSHLDWVDAVVNGTYKSYYETMYGDR